MFLNRNLLDHFWAEVVSTACHTLNMCLIKNILKKTRYELLRSNKHNNSKNNLGKFYLRSEEGISQGYSPFRRAFRVFNI